MDDGKDKPKDGLRINLNTTSINSPTFDKRPLPVDHVDDLDRTSAIRSASPVVDILATARVITDISTVSYPEGVQGPHPELNQNAKNGKFRYDREFLLQFMPVCKESPATLPPLDAIGLEPVDHTHAMTRGWLGYRPGGAIPPSRQASVGLGFTPSKPVANNLFRMGNFATMGAGSKLSSEERCASINRAAVVSWAQYASNRPSTIQITASQGDAGAPLQKRVRSKRGLTGRENRNENNTGMVPGGSGGQGHGSGFNNMDQMQKLDSVVPLQASENRWDGEAIQVDQDSPEVVERKVRDLLNKLTIKTFASISDQIIACANKSENQKDGRILIQLIRLVVENATDEATSIMCARLCKKMMEQISSNFRDDGIKNLKGKPITGGQLFRKYLLNRCQEDFERWWVAKEATAAEAGATNAKAKEGGTEEINIVPYSDEYYAARKAKRQGLGLIMFIGELFKLRMLTERIMHECVKKLLCNVDNPKEEEIESLCKLFTTVGSMLDIQKARAHMDVYFSRMKKLMESPNVTPRIKYMLLDLLELRERKWVASDPRLPNWVANYKIQLRRNEVN